MCTLIYIQLTLGAATRKVVEVQVNPEFGKAGALAVAEKYAPVVGRLPAFLLTDVDTIWIHRGNEGFGGGNRDHRIATFLISFVLNKLENTVGIQYCDYVPREQVKE